MDDKPYVVSQEMIEKATRTVGPHAVIATLIAPLERVRILLQVQHVHKGIPVNQRYKGVVDCFSRSVKQHGVRSLWRGNSVDIVKILPREYMHLMIPPIFKKAIVSADPESQRQRYFLEATLAGTLATTVYLLFLYPFDVVRLKLGADVGLT